MCVCSEVCILGFIPKKFSSRKVVMAIPKTTFWSEFIKVFRNENTLWETKSENYKSKLKREQSWAKLTEKYKEFEPHADVNIVKKKINGMRNSYRRELAKLKKSIKSGTGKEEVYKPSLWYFKELDFLRDYAVQKQDVATFDSKSSVEDEPVSSPSRKRKKPTPNSEFLAKAIQHLDQKKPERDEADVFAEAWATIYRKLTPEQKIYARHGIDKLLLQGELGNLHMNAVQIVPRAPSRPAETYTFSRSSTPYSSSSIPDSISKTNIQAPVPVRLERYHEVLPAQSFSKLFTPEEYQ